MVERFRNMFAQKPVGNMFERDYLDERMSMIRTHARNTSEEFIHSMIRRMHGRRISASEALSIVNHMCTCMEPEETHKFLYEIHRIYPEVSEHHTREMQRWERERWEYDNKLAIKPQTKTIAIPLPKEDFLSKEDVKIE